MPPSRSTDYSAQPLLRALGSAQGRVRTLIDRALRGLPSTATVGEVVERLEPLRDVRPLLAKQASRTSALREAFQTLYGRTPPAPQPPVRRFGSDAEQPPLRGRTFDYVAFDDLSHWPQPGRRSGMSMSGVTRMVMSHGDWNDILQFSSAPAEEDPRVVNPLQLPQRMIDPQSIRILGEIQARDDAEIFAALDAVANHAVTYTSADPAVGWNFSEVVGMGITNPRAAEVLGGTGIQGRRVTVPEFEIASNPTIQLSDVRERRFPFGGRTETFYQKRTAWYIKGLLASRPKPRYRNKPNPFEEDQRELRGMPVALPPSDHVLPLRSEEDEFKANVGPELVKPSLPPFLAEVGGPAGGLVEPGGLIGREDCRIW